MTAARRVDHLRAQLWRAAVEKSAAEGTTVTAVVLDALRVYVTTPPPERAGG